MQNKELQELFILAANKLLLKDKRTFKIDAENKEQLKQVIQYFNFDDTLNGNLEKGLLIQGNVGSGKTFFFDVFKIINTRPFWYQKARDVVAQFEKTGYDIITNNTKKCIKINFGQTELHHSFYDDLGTEFNGRFFGQEVNVFAEIIQDRYDLWKTHRLLTHFTTNLTDTEIELKYGDRVLSRLKEMCNFLKLGNGKNSVDRRSS